MSDIAELCAGRTRLSPNSRNPVNLKSEQPNRWPTAATCRAPIPRVSPRPASRSRHNPPTPPDYTSRGNLGGVVTNGTAVLGLGNIGALASKPVMEGKAVLFKKFADIDCFDIEVNESDPEKLADIVCALEPTFGAINLEDIKAPDCFHRGENLPRAHEHPCIS